MMMMMMMMMMIIIIIIIIIIIMLVLQPGSSLDLLKDASPRNFIHEKNQHSKFSVFVRILRGWREGGGGKSSHNLYRHKSSKNKRFNDSSDNKTGFFFYGDEFFICIDSDERMTPETGQCQKMQAVGSGR
jgi:hypothetical protein